MDLIGEQVGDYRIESLIGQGGMAVVYAAVQPLIDKKVAIKVLAPYLASDSEEALRFLTEARLSSAISHRGIINVFGFGHLPDGRQYMVMELLHGESLDVYLRRRGRLEVQEALTLLDEVLAALGAAHGAGIVHRDLKPSNVFLVQQPEGTRHVKLLDFGIARRQIPDEHTPSTLPGQVLGTPAYMAPEQVRGGPVGPWTDLYALGLLAFRMLTGKRPFTGEPHQLLLAQVEQLPPVPSSLAPELPPGLDALLLALMEKRPERRPSAVEVRRWLADLQRRLPQPRSVSKHAPVARKRWRRWGVLGGMAGGLLLLWSRTDGAPDPIPPVPVVAPPSAPLVVAPPFAQRPEPASEPAPALEEAPPHEAPRTSPKVGRATPVPVRSQVKPRSLLERVERVERVWRERVHAGTPPQPLAEAFLDQVRRDAEQARTAGQQRKAEQRLDAWIQRYLR